MVIIDNRNKDVDIPEEELDKLEEEDKKKNGEGEEPDEPEIEEETPEEEPEDDPESPDETPGEEETPEEEPEGTPEEQDYKKRHAESTREAQILLNRNKKFTESVDNAAKIPEPTDDEMKVYVKDLGADWDKLTPFERNTAKRTYLSEKRFEMVNQSVQETREIDQWGKKVDEFTGDDAAKKNYPKLNGRETEFKAYAMKKSHRGADMDVLVKSFLFDVKPKRTGRSLFETSNGGEGKKINVSGKITAEDAKFLRENKPQEYQRLLKQGRINIDI